MTKKKVAIFGGSFNPPCKHHVQIITQLTLYFNYVVVVPCGMRSDKRSTYSISENHRKHMIGIALSNMRNTIIDFYDLNHQVFTPTYYLDKRYKEQFAHSDIWHVVGGDIIVGGREHKSEIHCTWVKGHVLWKKLNFFVIERPGGLVEKSDMPPKSHLLTISNLFGASTMVRQFIKHGVWSRQLLNENVMHYIKSNNLYH